MIDWLAHGRPESPFLATEERIWTYGEAAEEVSARRSGRAALEPTLSPGSVFEILASIRNGTCVVLAPGQAAPVAVAPDETALVVFTSGSTSSPKGVRLTHANLIAACHASVSHLGHGPEDSWLAAMPLHHVGGLSILLRSAHAGGSVRLMPRFDPATFADALRSGVTIASVVPTMLRLVLDHDSGPYQGVKAVLVGGGPIPPGLLERAADSGLPALPTYGMTETFGQVATSIPGSPVDYRAHPLPGIELRITDDGRIAVRGDQVSPGYLGEPDRADPWLVTNDLGQLDGDGALRVLGRGDVVIVSGGENVDPVRVEEAIRAVDGVTDVIVVGVPDDLWGMRVTAVYSGSVADDVVAGAMTGLSGHMAPKAWMRVEVVPRTALGKPDRAAALQLALGRE